MKVIRKITQNSLRDKARSSAIRKDREIERVNGWINILKTEFLHIFIYKIQFVPHMETYYVSTINIRRASFTVFLLIDALQPV
jgi:hypothetical protein